jgi:hypothetical protein
MPQFRTYRVGLYFAFRAADECVHMLVCISDTSRLHREQYIYDMCKLLIGAICIFFFCMMIDIDVR